MAEGVGARRDAEAGKAEAKGGAKATRAAEAT